MDEDIFYMFGEDIDIKKEHWEPEGAPVFTSFESAKRWPEDAEWGPEGNKLTVVRVKIIRLYAEEILKVKITRQYVGEGEEEEEESLHYG